MAEVEIYDSSESSLSSDEYADDDDLMNAAISKRTVGAASKSSSLNTTPEKCSTTTTVAAATTLSSSAVTASSSTAVAITPIKTPGRFLQTTKVPNKPIPPRGPEQTLKEIRMLTKKNRMHLFYKTRSIKCLNERSKREGTRLLLKRRIQQKQQMSVARAQLKLLEAQSMQAEVARYMSKTPAALFHHQQQQQLQDQHQQQQYGLFALSAAKFITQEQQARLEAAVQQEISAQLKQQKLEQRTPTKSPELVCLDDTEPEDTPEKDEPPLKRDTKIPLKVRTNMSVPANSSLVQNNTANETIKLDDDDVMPIHDVDDDEQEFMDITKSEPATPTKSNLCITSVESMHIDARKSMSNLPEQAAMHRPHVTQAAASYPQIVAVCSQQQGTPSTAQVRPAPPATPIEKSPEVMRQAVAVAASTPQPAAVPQEHAASSKPQLSASAANSRAALLQMVKSAQSVPIMHHQQQEQPQQPIASNKRRRSDTPEIEERIEPTPPIPVAPAAPVVAIATSVASTQTPPYLLNQLTKKPSPTATPAPAAAAATPVSAPQTPTVKRSTSLDPNSSAAFYQKIKEMFPEYNETIFNQVQFANPTVQAINEKITRLNTDLHALDDMIDTKEEEWNRLVYMKRVKQELLERLLRKRHIVQNNEKYASLKGCNLQELSELEQYLAKEEQAEVQSQRQKHSQEQRSRTFASVAHQLIHNRANMQPEDLERLKHDIKPLQDILRVREQTRPHAASRAEERPTRSNAANELKLLQEFLFAQPNRSNRGQRNSLPSMFSAASSGDNHSASQQPPQQSNVGRQGAFKDVKSIIDDFRRQNPDVGGARVGKRFKSDTNHNLYKNSMSYEDIPTLQKLLNVGIGNGNGSRAATLRSVGHEAAGGGGSMSAAASWQHLQQQQHATGGGRAQYDDPTLEVSITPILNNHRSLSNNSNMRPRINYNDYNHDGGIVPNGDAHETQRYCQHCYKHMARFICAGCGQQWYCSRDCQLSAWDKHSDICAK